MVLVEKEIKPGVPMELSPLVTRIVAPNQSVMTGPSTNTYVIGRRELAVIDPGPLSEIHTRRLLDLAESRQGAIRWILCTHTHKDHSPGAAPLNEATGATMLGMPAPDLDAAQDQTFTSDRPMAHGDVLETGDFTIEAVHTPGHVGNHLCFLLRDEGMLFTGDHINNGSTVVILPPSGHMGHYIRSLRLVKEVGATRIAPGHGEVMPEPDKVVDYLVAHRLRREDKVMTCLTRVGPCAVPELVAHVYDDTPVYLHKLAQRSLLAHLIKLEEDGRVAIEDDRWRCV